ncbi:uncharacterized protein LOC134528504 isoform X3 [Bacillus rossius redtenbacheri]|uniref:uncharacterized protein LOC134528504 isoform X3 n=1 Tax=Bacillus rossius redtenbacheri TaxID=93214 RepID=UPI002FDD1C94
MLRRWGRTPRLSRRNCWTSTLSSPTCTGSRYCCESGDPPYVSHVLWNCSSSFPGWTQAGSGGKHALTARLSPIAARIYKRFRSIDPDGVRASLQYRINAGDILAEFRELKCNPYADRLVRVFSSLGDHHLSFEDLLDLFSALSERCPAAVKARWLFKVLGDRRDGPGAHGQHHGPRAGARSAQDARLLARLHRQALASPPDTHHPSPSRGVSTRECPSFNGIL